MKRAKQRTFSKLDYHLAADGSLHFRPQAPDDPTLREFQQVVRDFMRRFPDAKMNLFAYHDEAPHDWQLQEERAPRVLLPALPQG